MEMKKYSIIIAASAAFCLCGHRLSAQESYRGADPVGTVSYSLPRTVISLEVEAVRESFHAGPYSAYAEKYLGVKAATEDRNSCTVVSVKMTPFSEADPESRFSLVPGKGLDAFLSLTTQGLVSFGGAGDSGAQWRFPTESEADFSGRGVSSNLSSETAVLRAGVRRGDRFETLSVNQNMVVEKPLETRARETAEMIFTLREKRLAIVTGDTDATYSGEAMEAAIREIGRLEDEYLSMFLGYTDSQVQKMNYDVVPSREGGRTVAFRVSDEAGLVGPEDLSGRPYLLEVVPQDIREAAPAGKTGASKVAYYRIPAICTVTLSDGVDVLLRSRMRVYQLGTESTLPLQ